MIEIPSPTQTYNDRPLPRASEWQGSTLRIPIYPDWPLRAEVSATLYGTAAIEVVTLDKKRWYNSSANAIYELWAIGSAPCQIENLCDECKGRGERRDAMDRESHDCSYCDGRGWFYDD